MPTEIFLLEYANGLALRAHLACLSMFATSFGDETEESPPSAASANAFRAQALTSTVLHAASSDLLPGIADNIHCEFPRGRSDKRGWAGRFEVEHVLEIPQHLPP